LKETTRRPRCDSTFWLWQFLLSATTQAKGGPLRDSFEHDIALSNFTAPVRERERVNTADATAFANHISIFRNLQQESLSHFHLTVFAFDMFDQENAALLIELDIPIDEIRSCDANGLASGFLCDHVDGFLRERVPEQRSLASAFAHDRVHGLTPATPVVLLFVRPFSNQHH